VVLDFRIYYDQGTGNYILIKTSYTSLSYLINTLTPGVTYGFKVQARNAFGLSDLSSPLSLLCATVPAAPAAPLTSASGSQLTITWTTPYNSGSVVTGYNVYLVSSTGTPILETTYCANSPTIVTALSCSLPVSVLTLPPYGLSLGDSVYATVVGINQYGNGVMSTNGNGATCLLVPTAPLLLTNNALITSQTQIGFTWSPSSSTGGSSIIDYRVSYD
jgi:hypothetical protein